MRLAIEHVRRMRGGSQAHLMRCDDGSYYVVKFQNNPQGATRTLVNEMFGTRLAARMGICVPEVDLIDVREALVRNTADLRVQLGIGHVPCSAGIQFGSKFPGNPSKVKVYDLGWFEYIDQIENIQDFFGVLVFDKWTGNFDNRQAILISKHNAKPHNSPRRVFKAMMIDQGFCFGGNAWDFPDGPRLSLCARREVYKSVRGIEDFEPWLRWLENDLSLDILYQDAEKVPVEWLSRDQEAWRGLIERLYARRTQLRPLIWSAKNSVPNFFPNWIRPTCRVAAAST
jgi:hypothetical protein